MVTKLKFLVAKLKVLVALATVSVAISSPVLNLLLCLFFRLKLCFKGNQGLPSSESFREQLVSSVIFIYCTPRVLNIVFRLFLIHAMDLAVKKGQLIV